MASNRKREGGVAISARFFPSETVEAIRTLHHEWQCDGEIAERLGLNPLAVWHARQAHNINRHNRRRGVE